jgi:putative oxygen-independent coproporphyrinogen III oxidase
VTIDLQQAASARAAAPSTGDTSLGLPPLALYIHIPWCVRKCPYCDFNSHALRDGLPQDDYVAALLADLEQDLPLVWGRPVTSIFFGGGTPSLFDAAHIGAILDGVAARLSMRPGLEVTLETNPGTVEHDRFEGYRAAGVNRLSFGVQSFDDGCLERLGRIHDSAQAVQAIELAQAAGFDNINLDLMYALPGQTLPMALADIERGIALGTPHLSHYQLTLEPNTLFHARPPPQLPDEDGAWDMQEACQARLADAGLAQYEISAYARNGRQCAHNINYWRFGDYLGIGAGAHGKLTQPAANGILRRWKLKHPRSYMDSAGTPAGIGGDDWIGHAERPFEFMLNALRLRDGFSFEQFEVRTGLSRAAIEEALGVAMARAWLHVDEDRVRPTETGQRFLNDAIELFLP